MDERTRGFIESMMDEAMQEDITPDIEWVQKEVPISSMGELAIGYAIGVLRAAAVVVAGLKEKRNSREEEANKKVIDGIIKRRLPEIIEKINRELNI